MAKVTNRTTINSKYPRCVDGRAAEVFVAWNTEEKAWEIDGRGADAKAENGPQFLGASLAFVRALEEVEGWEREQAFDLVEKASLQLDWGLQFHLDDKHGEYDFSALTDEELLELAVVHHTGCGFAKYAWKDAGEEVIEEAKNRHWRMQLLVGDHQEKGAVLNYQEGETFDTAQAVFQNISKFNTDVAEARKMFVVLGELIKSETFAQEAEEWMVKTYNDVVVALKGVESADQVEVIK